MELVRTYPEGATSWIDVEHRDLEAAKDFYGGIFGWTFADATPPGVSPRYVIARLDNRDVAGLGEGTAGATPAWNTYVAVLDSEAAADRIRSAGGQVLSGPADAGDGGRATLCADPAGVPFRLWQARNRPGAQAVNMPGAWNFSDLHAADPAASASRASTSRRGSRMPSEGSRACSPARRRTGTWHSRLPTAIRPPPRLNAGAGRCLAKPRPTGPGMP